MSYLLNENEMERIVDTLKNAKACDYKLNLSESPPPPPTPEAIAWVRGLQATWWQPWPNHRVQSARFYGAAGECGLRTPRAGA